MSSLQKILMYDDAQPVTVSDSVDDPAGPFAALYCLTAGTVKVQPYARAQNSTSNPISFPMTAGQYLNLSVRRVWSTGTTGTYAGLISSVVRQGT
jgi:hypothetical protein